MEKQCSKCGYYTVNDAQSFCPQCGVLLDELRKCKDCGYTLLKHWKFCAKCGMEAK